jgi:hypothetical protein
LTLVFFTDRDLGTLFPEILKDAGFSVERHRDHFPSSASASSSRPALDPPWPPDANPVVRRGGAPAPQAQQNPRLRSAQAQDACRHARVVAAAPYGHLDFVKSRREDLKVGGTGRLALTAPSAPE